MAGETTPGLRAASRDQAFPARTRVIGIEDRIYLKAELLESGLVHDDAAGAWLVGVNSTVNGFSDTLDGTPLSLALQPGSKLFDTASETLWDIRGKRLEGASELAAGFS